MGSSQESCWSGVFGDDYIERNPLSDNVLGSNLYLFSKIFEKMVKPVSLIEFGAGTGLNLKVIQSLFPGVVLSAVEINKIAVDRLKDFVKGVDVFHGSVYDYVSTNVFDVVLTKGFLVHIPRDRLNSVYDILYRSCGRFIVLCEYYNPCFVPVDYRGFDDLLFKNDYAGDMLDRFKDLKLHGYGFVYHRDNVFPQDDVSWFILEKI